MATMGDVGQRIEVTTVGCVGTETDSGEEKLKWKCFVVERSGEVEKDKAEEAIIAEALCLKKKVIQDCKVQKGAKFQIFEYHALGRAGRAEKFVKFSIFINQKGELVMLSTVQKKGLVWSGKTIAQRD